SFPPGSGRSSLCQCRVGKSLPMPQWPGLPTGAPLPASSFLETRSWTSSPFIGELAAWSEDGHSRNQSSTPAHRVHKPQDDNGLGTNGWRDRSNSKSPSTSKDYRFGRASAIFTEVSIRQSPYFRIRSK